LGLTAVGRDIFFTFLLFKLITNFIYL